MSYVIGSLLIFCRWLFEFSFSVARSTCTGGGGSSGGKSIDKGLDESGGDVLIHPFDCDSGDNRQVAADEGGVNGIHIGASGDRDDELINNGIGRFVERAANRTARSTKDCSFERKTKLTSKSCSSRCWRWCR